MAFLRFSRDKRGYEHFYLVEATKNRRGKTRARVLYWYRTPPGVKVGREPFDPELRRAIEAQNPGVTFDWRKITETPIPSADAEHWRERRRLARAERAVRRSASTREAAPASDMPGPGAETMDEDTGLVPEQEPELPGDTEIFDISIDAAERKADALEPTEESLVCDAASIEPSAPEPIASSNPGEPVMADAPAARRRRRRRRRRRGQGHQPGAPSEHRERGENADAPKRDGE